MRRFRAVAILVASIAAACSSAPRPSATVSIGLPPPKSPIRVEGTWASGAGPHTAYVYFILSNQGSANDVLLGASSPIAEDAVVQQASPNGRLHAIDDLVIPAGGEVSFGPGDYDVELTGLSSPPRSGSVVRLVLRLENAGSIPFTAGVR